MRAPLNQIVGYVAPPTKAGEQPKIKKGTVLEAFDDGSARIDMTDVDDEGNPAKKGESRGHHVALATFDPDKKRENSWHELEAQPSSAPASPATRKAPVPAAAT